MVYTIPLNHQRAQQALQHCPIGHTIEYYPIVDSTMSLAQHLAKQTTTPSGVVVIAEEQSSGRGRQQRHWQAPPATSLLLSIILKTPHLTGMPGLLPAITGLAVLEMIETLDSSLHQTCGLKWPNDVLLGTERNNTGKVAGILIESAFGNNGLDHAVIGIGINVNQTIDELPPALPNAPAATSLAIFLGRPLDRTELLITLCQRWAAWLTASQNPDQVWQRWRNRLWTLGQPVAVYEAGKCIATGKAVDVTAEGGLIVCDVHGIHNVFHAGDVSIRFSA